MKPFAPRTALIALTAAVTAALVTVGHTEPAERQAGAFGEPGTVIGA